MNNEGMGRREHKDGDEVDYLTTSRSRGGNDGPVTNHSLRAKVKTANRRRTRREARQGLRNSQEG